MERALRDGADRHRPPLPAPPVRQPSVPTVRTAGTKFVGPTDQPFHWRGITAFRLAGLVASGREDEAVAYLDWASSQQITVVRVLLTARHLFKLSSEQGLKALPRLLDLAKARGLAV
ncbi:MAG: hypothetical protein H0U19_07495, partial [Acidobacteria bacterium]|nr:hypothetical protein [Acidobacteriota bacterium]